MYDHPLAQEEKNRLVTIILETNEHRINFDLFGEMIAVLSEDIPGLEFMTEDDLSSLISECWEIYQQIPVAQSQDE